MDINKNGLITTGYHIPYNPKLKQRARELRKNMTETEQKLWQDFLRYFKFQVYRQKPINNYIVDFYCPKLKLVIEIDGMHHKQIDNKIYDENRKHILNGFGLTELRFTNKQVLFNFDEVCRKIEEFNPPKSPFI
jgi:very-short-patch-repair endonuclease